MTYGQLAKQVRTARGLTQAELAAVSGLAQSNISAIETGRRLPSAETLQRLLESCGFQLAAVAGRQVVACRSLLDDEAVDDRVGGGLDEAPAVTPTTPLRDRVRVLTAALDASEAVVRGRGWTSST